MLSYASVVFSEDDLNKMKQESMMMQNSTSEMLLLNQSQEMSTEENKSGDIGSVVKNSLKTGFGSIIGIFGKDE